MALDLFSMQRGKRARKKKGDGTKKKKSPGVIRVQIDLDELDLPHNVQLDVPNRDNLQEFQVRVTPDEGYWKGVAYTFKFVMPDEYPYKPPKVTCIEKIYHPNIDLQGNVCLNLLRKDWRPILTVEQIIHGLIFLFLEPNPADPLNQEAAEVFRNNEPLFRSNVQKSLRGGMVQGVRFDRANRGW